MASVDGAFSNEVVHFFVRMGIVLCSWTHADHDSPSRVRSKNKNGIVHSSKLGVHSSLHLVPLVHLEGVTCDIGGESVGTISMESVTVRELRLVILTIWFHE